MIPTDEGFHAAQFPVFQGYDRLVNEKELVGAG
jgi:hypothetical protein